MTSMKMKAKYAENNEISASICNQSKSEEEENRKYRNGEKQYGNNQSAKAIMKM